MRFRSELHYSNSATTPDHPLVTPLDFKSLLQEFITFCIIGIFCRYDMSTADAIDLGRRAIVHAAHRDAASGNIVRSE